jgi:hypothetical protein
MSHCLHSGAMPVDGSLLNALSGQEMAWDLKEKGRRLMRSYVRLGTRLVVQRVTLPEELEQDVVMAYQAVLQADPIGASADYGRKLEHLQWMLEELENGLGYSEPQQLSTNISQQYQPPAQLSSNISQLQQPNRSSHAESSAGPEGEEAQEAMELSSGSSLGAVRAYLRNTGAMALSAVNSMGGMKANLGNAAKPSG